jgi:hypothetical protein
VGERHHRRSSLGAAAPFLHSTNGTASRIYNAGGITDLRNMELKKRETRSREQRQEFRFDF